MYPLLALLWISLAQLSCCRTQACIPTVHDGRLNVTYTGVSLPGVDKFFSIHYGKDTSGENRFARPRPFVPPHGSVVNAATPGPACPQPLGAPTVPLGLSNITDISEDCLHLNIARPVGTCSDAKLPVMLYIHGGGLWSGSNNEITTSPDGLVLESVANGLPILHVGINYRLNLFGFAPSSALKSTKSLNAGLRDQRLAIEWVRDHIEYFGGDPSRVTIFGQSSGGLSVGMQILAYGGERGAPFQQGICESQALEVGITGNFTSNAFAGVVALTSCNSSTPNSNHTLQCLRELPLKTLLNATITQYQNDGSNIGDIWLPIVDDDFVPDAPSKLVESGRFSNVTTMQGWTEDDASYFTDSTIATANDTRSFISSYLPNLNSTFLTELLRLYPVSDFPYNPAANLSAQFYRSARIVRDVLLVCEPIYLGSALAEKGNDVFYYVQNQTILTGALESLGHPGLGVIHTSEFAYVYGNFSHYNVSGLPFDPQPEDYVLRDRESRSWSSFAALGSPSVAGTDTLIGWEEAYGGGNSTRLFVIGGPEAGLSALGGAGANAAVAKQRLEERCAFINRRDVIEQLNY